MSQIQVTMPMVEGQPILPSTAKGPDGKPRFHVPLLKELINTDGGVRYLVSYESVYGGYEASSRQFFDAHLEPGDVFIDVGAHWGVFSLSAATRHPGQVAVIAVEPHPLNATQLLKAVRINKLVASIEVIAAAAGDEAGMAQLRHASTMGHTLDEGTPGRADVAVLQVPIVTVDALIQRRPDLDGRRVFLKIDVEGFEYEVLLGARQLMESGRVAAVMWEKGEAYSTPAGSEKMAALVRELDRLGYRNYRFPSSEFAGPLIPFAPTPELGNVFALAPGFQRLPVYELPFEPRPPFNMLFATPSDPATRAQTTRLLLEARSSDGARWANPHELSEGSQERAVAAAAHLAPGSHVLDLGAGALALRRHLSAGCRYTPADLLPRSADCLLVDLNQQQFPEGQFDCIALLEVLEYIHDPAWLLGRCRAAAARLVFTYHLRSREPVEERRQRGWFNDMDSQTLAAVIHSAGWRIESQSPAADAVLFVCSRDESPDPT
jgi:FkbM family methyltransferase